MVHSTAVESVDPVVGLNSARVVQTNPANFPFTSFAPDATWAINTQSAIDVEVACNLPTHATRVTHYGVFVDVAARWVGDAVDRVLITSMPPNITDASTAAIFGHVRHQVRASTHSVPDNDIDGHFDLLEDWLITAAQMLNIQCNT